MELLPQLAAVQVTSVVIDDGAVRVTARTRSGARARCPGCAAVAGRVHSWYQRTVQDRQVGSRTVVIELSVRRWLCRNPHCAKATFAEQVEGLTDRYQRRTPALRTVLEALAVALASKAGSRLAVVLGSVVSWMTMLNVVMRIADPPAGTPRVLGVDDLALHRGQRYATLLVDVETGLPIELWDTREAAPLVAWLREHRGVEEVCRDGSGEFRAGIERGAPDALQVSDRFHLWQNLVKQVKDIVAAHHTCLAIQPPPRTDLAPGDPATSAPAEPSGRSAQRAQRTFAAVHDLLDQGFGIRQIARSLSMGRATVRRYAAAQAWQQMPKAWPRRGSILDPFHTYLTERFADGEHRATALFSEIQQRGYTGRYTVVAAFLNPLRTQVPAIPPPPTVSEVTGWLTRKPEHLGEQESTTLKAILAHCPELTQTAGLIRRFATMLTGGSSTPLAEWIAAARDSGLKPMTRYANALAGDLDAVKAGLDSPHSSGVVEGRVNDVKYLKRQMFGAAKIPLLRKRVLLVAAARRASTRPRPTPAEDPWLTPATKIL